MRKRLLRIEPFRLRATTTLTAIRVGLLDWRPLALALVCALVILLVAQFPPSYAFNVGVERGPLSDEPFLQSFYPTEGEWPNGLFRWSRTEYATIELPGLGQRGVILGLTIASHRSQHDQSQPATILTLRHAGPGVSPTFPLRREAAHYQIYLPPAALPDGALRVRLDTPTWQNPGDSRDEIGVALAQSVRLWSVRPSGATLPDLGLLGGLPFGVVLIWGALRVCGFARRPALLLALPLAVLIPLLTLLDAPRAGFLGPWLPAFGLLLLGSAAAALLVLPTILRWCGTPAPATALHWLALLVALTFALKYGGRLYPEAMPGDWQLHINRFTITALGDLAIQAKHRGLPFPFPPGYYLDIAPLTLLGFDIRPILPILAALFEAASIPVIYAIPARLIGSARMGLLAAAIYALTATGFMNTWFSFHTQVSTQFFTALLMLVLIACWPRYHNPRIWWPIVFLLGQQFLGHIGTFINAGLLGVLAIAVLWLRANNQQERRSTLALLAAGTAAGAFVLVFYYSAFAGLIVEQISGVANRGLLDVSGKKPVLAATYLQVLWQGGLITHYGFFPVLLAIPGALTLTRRLRRSALPILLWGTIAVSCGQALLPFITQSAITTRWLTFAAWAIAVAGGAGLLLWWRRGRAARIVALAMAGYVCWITAIIFIEAMTQRLPPIEPF
jgi:hypothetical protein